jgi:hypothetical protein
VEREYAKRCRRIGAPGRQRTRPGPAR